MIIFDGKAEAKTRRERLAEKVNKLPQLTIFSLVFQEDMPSTIYTKLKKKDAQLVGIGYDDVYLPISTPVETIQKMIREAAAHEGVTGIIIQKPAKTLMPSDTWWGEVVSVLPPEKDVDGLTGRGKVLPATAQAILQILQIALKQLGMTLTNKRILVLGRSDIVGRPTAQALQEQGHRVQLFGRANLAQHPEALGEADVLITATGESNLVSAKQLKDGVIVIDAGSPNSEVDPTNLQKKASFLSPVPGGVGPMTRVCLLENLVDMLE